MRKEEEDRAHIACLVCPFFLILCIGTRYYDPYHRQILAGIYGGLVISRAVVRDVFSGRELTKFCLIIRH